MGLVMLASTRGMSTSPIQAVKFLGKCAFILVQSKLSIPRAVTNLSFDIALQQQMAFVRFCHRKFTQRSHAWIKVCIYTSGSCLPSRVRLDYADAVIYIRESVLSIESSKFSATDR